MGGDMSTGYPQVMHKLTGPELSKVREAMKYLDLSKQVKNQVIRAVEQYALESIAKG